MLPEYLTVPFDLYYTGIIGNLVMFVMGYLLGRTIFRNKKSLKDLTIWTSKEKNL